MRPWKSLSSLPPSVRRAMLPRALALAAFAGGIVFVQAVTANAAFAAGVAVLGAGGLVAFDATRRRSGRPAGLVALERWADTGRPPAPEALGDDQAVTQWVARIARRERSIQDGLLRLGSLLSPMPDQLRTLARTTSDGGAAIEEGVEETASRLSQLDRSLVVIRDEVQGLGGAAETIQSSALEMGASIDTVAEAASALDEETRDSASALQELDARAAQASETTEGVLAMAEETAAAMVEMDRAIQEVNQHAAEAADLTDRVRGSAEAGVAAMRETASGIDRIRGETGRARDVIVRLEERIRQIDEILAVIGSINDETNLLSLNAAIIAAQAGEQGKAFAVVAHHVKQLAQRTGKSTEEIAALIADIQDEARGAVEAIAQGMTSVEQGVELSQRAGRELGQIERAALDASQRVGGIARATQEQSRNSNHVAQAAQETSALVQTIHDILASQRAASSAMLTRSGEQIERCDGVRRTTEEQRETARFISESVNAIAETIRSVETNTKEHGIASRSASESIGRILDAAQRGIVEPEALLRQIEEAREGLEELLARDRDQSAAGDPAASATESPA